MNNYREILREVQKYGPYHLKDVVYLVADIEQKPYVITGIIFNPNGIMYEVSDGLNVFRVFICEISSEKIIY